MNTEQKHHEPTLGRVRLIGFALLAAPAVYAVVLAGLWQYEALEPMLTADLQTPAAAVLTVLSVCGAVGSLYLRQVMVRRLPAAPTAQHAVGIVVVSMAAAESGAVFGLVYGILSGEFALPLILCLGALIVAGFHLPSSSFLAHFETPGRVEHHAPGVR